MKKPFAVGLLALGLIAAGGTGAYLEKVNNTTNHVSFMQQQGMNSGKAVQMMNSTSSNNVQPLVDKPQNSNQDNGFEQMLPYMKKMHPNLSDQQLKALYEQMHGPNGACQAMMGNTNDSTSSNNGNLQ